MRAQPHKQTAESKAAFGYAPQGQINRAMIIRPTVVLPDDDRLFGDLVCPVVFRVDRLAAFHLGGARLYGAPQ